MSLDGRQHLPPAAPLAVLVGAGPVRGPPDVLLLPGGPAGTPRPPPPHLPRTDSLIPRGDGDRHYLHKGELYRPPCFVLSYFYTTV